MSTLAFVLFWVIVALVLMYVALRGGKGAKERARPSSSDRKLPYIAFGAALLALGVAIPGLVIAAVRDQDSIPQAGIDELTERQERGRELFAEQCRMCHTLEAAAAVAVVGPNLDKLRPTYGLTLDAIEQGRARGNGAMAADLVVGEDAEAVAAFVARAVGQDESIGTEQIVGGGEAEAEGGENPVSGDQEVGGGGAPGGDTAPGEVGAGDTPAGTAGDE